MKRYILYLGCNLYLKSELVSRSKLTLRTVNGVHDSAIFVALVCRDISSKKRDKCVEVVEKYHN